MDEPFVEGDRNAQALETVGLRAGEGYLGGNPPELHFGLGRVESTASVTVRWPDGDESVHGDVQVNRWSRIERDATAAPAAPSSKSSSPARRER